MSPPDSSPVPVLPGGVVLFDGVCTLCNGAVRWIIARDPDARFRFASLQSEAAQPLLRAAGLPEGYTGSLVLLEDGRVFTQSDGALRIARHLRGWDWAWSLRHVPRPLRNAVYDLVARSRYRVFGKEEACPLPTPELRARLLPGGTGP